VGGGLVRRDRLSLVIAALAALSAACGRGSAGDTTLRSEVSHVGDTTVVMNHGEVARVRRDSVRVIWRSPELQYPRTLLILDDRLIVADEKRIHILSPDGEFLRSVGREGHGPREFEYIVSLGQFGADTLAVHDGENQRLTFFTPDGDFLGSAPYRGLLPYGNCVNGYLPSLLDVRRGVARLRGGVVSLWREGINWTRPTRTALVWHDLNADTAAVLESWDGEQWFRAGGRHAATTEAFAPFVIAALASDGRLAVGNGLEYCIQTHVVMDGEFRKICRDRAPAPVGAGIRHPDLSRLDERLRQAFATVVGAQKIGKYLQQFDRLLFDAEDRLWVRTLGPEFSDLHPWFRFYAPQIRPPYRTWDVFDEAGRLLTTIEIPSNFDPQDIKAGRMYGFVELPTGEIAVGILAVPL
jgi:hypothetical protein